MLDPRNVLLCIYKFLLRVGFFYSLSVDGLTLYGFLIVDATLVVIWNAEGRSASTGNCRTSLIRETEGCQSISSHICALSIKGKCHVESTVNVCLLSDC